MKCMNIEQNYKWDALISFLEEKERKKTLEGKKKIKKNRALALSSLELSPFTLSNCRFSCDVAMFQILKLPFLLWF